MKNYEKKKPDIEIDRKEKVSEHSQEKYNMLIQKKYPSLEKKIENKKKLKKDERKTWYWNWQEKS